MLPAGRFAVSVLHRVDGTTVSRLARLSDGKVVRSFSEPPDAYGSSTQFAGWLTSRWLAVLENGRLTLYDATTDRVVRPDLPMTELRQLAFRPS